MRITIDIPENDIELIKKWASVSRTLNTAKEACDIAAHCANYHEKMNHCENELNTIEPMLNRLHQIIREQLKIEALSDEDKQALGIILCTHNYYAQSISGKKS